MRATALLILAASLIAIAPSAGDAKSCPANALKASTAIWPFGVLETGVTRTGTHPCGRQMTCVGGKWGPPQILRQCHWD